MKTICFADELIPGSAVRDLGLDAAEISAKHAPQTGSDHTLCGLAYGEYISKYRGGKITCGGCISAITYCKSFRKGIDY